ncbi:DUF262 domain-containing protein [Vibrio parahaemolyticus]|uniref:DUF262 domain-containing protein n=1 Tax=Vibrio parahaemolyticus TaxID=670 RepID=UPI00111F462A|nr:DUF262 domain-containing protein [Vibrio parahaemolyticus]MBD2857286.1 DUF262 domain-containing protein [Vibrio parahaemolyticus]MBW6448860.1 DUF262 domain-containing protein [Vibrio parahaemolyticus]TPA39107.1 DUF262 domain-containing protein [Vibrio parahaemolyticus]HAS3130124.1 DUF262 domain-containing protein [Vibrio parahaemolyticus]
MSNFQNKIEAKNRSILEVLDNKKYTVDYYQREYSWEQTHIEQLVTDLCNAFLDNYDPEHQRQDVAGYNSYYLGPFVLSERPDRRSIIDGQQRLTSLTLFLIYLNNQQKELGLNEAISGMIFSEQFGQKSFNIDVPERTACLDALFKQGEYTPPEDADASTINMVARYQNICDAFPVDRIDENVLPLFIDWLKWLVVLVEIVAYSDENAYTIFETMNDRGLNLTPTEMLKGFLLSKYRDDNKRKQSNDFWKQTIIDLKVFDKEEDQRFIQAWLRAKYAESIRQSKAGSLNEDFEKIGTRFHNWVRDNLSRMNLAKAGENEFDAFINTEFRYYVNAYKRLRNAEETFTPELDSIHYIYQWGIASSLSYPLMLAPLKTTDSVDLANQKMNLVAKYIDIFCVRRSVNFRNFSASSIRYTMYNLVKEIRNKDYSELLAIFDKKLDEMDEQWNGFEWFRLHGQNGRFVKYLLSRLSGYVDGLAGANTDFATYYHAANGKPFEIEHLWANNFENHKDEFEQQNDFYDTRNSIGALVLLPRGTNQSYSDKLYVEKLPHYIKENLLVKSLHPLTYENNPNFNKLSSCSGLAFKAHPEMKTADIKERCDLYRQIAEQIWCLEEESLGSI